MFAIIASLADAINQWRKQSQMQFLWFQSHLSSFTKKDLENAIAPLVMEQSELNEELKKLATQQAKIAAEQAERSDALLEKIDELTAIIEDADNVTDEVQESLTALKAAAQALDDVIPDAPPA